MVLADGDGSGTFVDKYAFYRWSIECRNNVITDTTACCCGAGEHHRTAPADTELGDAVDFLIEQAPDALFRIILAKRFVVNFFNISFAQYNSSFERTAAECRLIDDELAYMRALRALSSTVRRQLAAVVQFEVCVQCDDIIKQNLTAPSTRGHSNLQRGRHRNCLVHYPCRQCQRVYVSEG